MKSNQTPFRGHRLLTVGAALATSITLLTACGPSFKATQLSDAACVGSSCVNTPSGTGGGGTPTPSQSWDQLQFGGKVSGGPFDSSSVISIDKVNKMMVVRLPTFANPYMLEVTGQIPVKEIPGAYITIESNTDGNLYVLLNIPLNFVLRGIQFLPPSKLPNGDILPGVPDGEMPMVGVQLPTSKSTKVSIYLSPTVVALYVNSPFDPTIGLRFPIRSNDNRILGYFATVPAKASFDGGFFLSAKVPDDIARAIDANL